MSKCLDGCIAMLVGAWRFFKAIYGNDGWENGIIHVDSNLHSEQKSNSQNYGGPAFSAYLNSWFLALLDNDYIEVGS